MVIGNGSGYTKVYILKLRNVLSVKSYPIGFDNLKMACP